MTLKLQPSAALSVTPGDFGANIDPQTRDLLLPPTLYFYAVTRGVHTSDELLSYAETFPTDMSQSLRWTVDELQLAAHKLEQQLKDSGFLNMTPASAQKTHGYGARDPRPGQ